MHAQKFNEFFLRVDKMSLLKSTIPSFQYLLQRIKSSSVRRIDADGCAVSHSSFNRFFQGNIASASNALNTSDERTNSDFAANSPISKHHHIEKPSTPAEIFVVGPIVNPVSFLNLQMPITRCLSAYISSIKVIQRYQSSITRDQLSFDEAFHSLLIPARRADYGYPEDFIENVPNATTFLGDRSIAGMACLGG